MNRQLPSGIAAETERDRDRRRVPLGHAVAWLIGLGLALLVTRAEHARTTAGHGAQPPPIPNGKQQRDTA